MIERFDSARALRQNRFTVHYRGVKKNDNVYSGFLECGDCGAPMFAMSRSDLKDAYRCGTYHRRGLKGCTSHHIRVDKLESDLLRRMEGLQNQIAMTADKRNTIIRVNRAAKTAMEVFDDILNKEKLGRVDPELIIQKIVVYEDHLDIQIRTEADSLLRYGVLPEKTSGGN